MFFHVFGHACRLQGYDPCHDVDLLVQTAVNNLLHPLRELVDVQDALGLDEVRARAHFLRQADYSEFERVGEWIFGRADEEGMSPDTASR